MSNNNQFVHCPDSGLPSVERQAEPFKSFADYLADGDREAAAEPEPEPFKCFADYLGEGDREAMAQWEEEKRSGKKASPLPVDIDETTWPRDTLRS